MAFRVKNLMIQILPDASAKPQPGPANPEFCFLFFTGPPPPPPHGPTCPTSKPTFHTLDGANDPAALATLKQQLQTAIQIVEAREKAINESTTITTVEEAQALEEQLSSALEEVRQQKLQLQNKATGGGPA